MRSLTRACSKADEPRTLLAEVHPRGNDPTPSPAEVDPRLRPKASHLLQLLAQVAISIRQHRQLPKLSHCGAHSTRQLDALPMRNT